MLLTAPTAFAKRQPATNRTRSKPSLPRLHYPEIFNREVGLWTTAKPGHTRPVAEFSCVHSGVEAACRLVIGAQLHAIDQLPVPVARILAGIRRLQWLDGSPQHGCFKWYAEEPHPVDTNAAFFIGLNLIILSAAYRGQLDTAALAELDAMLGDLFFWFERESLTEALWYPNKYLGDLVCAWLLHEQIENGQSDTRLLAAMESAADYWRTNHWGWGEHLSDGYTGILFNELSALLLLARRLPESVRTDYTRLLRELLAIEDAYGGDIRVPVIRTYAFAARPSLQFWRDTIRPWLDPSDAQHVRRSTHFHFGHLFNELGWHALVGPRQPVRERISIPCFGGATARAWISEDDPRMRLGTMSRYPIMPHTDHVAWGLSWQSMPVAFSAGENGWGFLRWHTRENELDRFHPARDKHSAYLHNTLTDAVVPPIVGLTHSLQDGPDACILRRMPALSRSWDLLADQFVLTGTDFTIVREELGMDTSRLLLDAAGVPVTVFFLPLGAGVRPRLTRESAGEIIWEALWPEVTLARQERVACVWIICWGRDVSTLPGPRPFSDVSQENRYIRMHNDEAWQIAWPRAAGNVSVRIDPLATDPVRVV
ncbi:hypothetical protein Ga0100231_008160 [Opitutaceae bacterium TAV4]|nr:hypothetical protein Ga0100231_008160 [Opitutaceae bacterium TAV4]RRJ98426.1 hypothetical protein Ga0100230_008460 [Opitutaceae bacterium TAV3]